jgi:hypothetical protein
VFIYSDGGGGFGWHVGSVGFANAEEVVVEEEVV